MVVFQELRHAQLHWKLGTPVPAFEIAFEHVSLACYIRSTLKTSAFEALVAARTILPRPGADVLPTIGGAVWKWPMAEDRVVCQDRRYLATGIVIFLRQQHMQKFRAAPDGDRRDESEQGS